MTITRKFENFRCFNFKTNFLKKQTLFTKLECHFLAECTKIENAALPCKTTLSEANIKTNRLGSIKWTYHKERSFASNDFIFSKILFHFKNLVYKVDLMYQTPKWPYSYFLKAPKICVVWICNCVLKMPRNVSLELEFYLKVLCPCEYP